MDQPRPRFVFTPKTTLRPAGYDSHLEVALATVSNPKLSDEEKRSPLEGMLRCAYREIAPSAPSVPVTQEQQEQWLRVAKNKCDQLIDTFFNKGPETENQPSDNANDRSNMLRFLAAAQGLLLSQIRNNTFEPCRIMTAEYTLAGP